jgi:hypothetical protein
MVCNEILAQHSDYLDGLLAPHDAARVQWHLSRCGSCARYDRIVRRGLDLVRELPEVTPGADFEERLQHRIFHVQDGGSLGEPRAAGAAATLAVAGVIALLAWSPLLFNERHASSPAAAAEEPPPSESPVDYLPVPRLPGVAGDMRFPTPQPAPLTGGVMITTLASFPGPYSPLRVEPPVHGRAVRTVSSGYAPVD